MRQVALVDETDFLRNLGDGSGRLSQKLGRPISSSPSQQAHRSKLMAIAELIETEEAAKSLLAMGCRYGQGCYFSEPIEAEMALRRLLTQEPFEPPASSETMALPELSEDNSPTLLMSAESMGIATDQDS